MSKFDKFEFENECNFKKLKEIKIKASSMRLKIKEKKKAAGERAVAHHEAAEETVTADFYSKDRGTPSIWEHNWTVYGDSGWYDE